MSVSAENSSKHEGADPVTRTLPAVVAVFLVKFDDRKGYVLAWHRSIDNLDIEGVVEFKSMPSGLHNIHDDLVYFVHEDYAGISAVLNVEDLQAARKARVIAVGVLIPLEHGRMGKSWLHAENLKQLAETQITKTDDYSALEQYWEEYKLPTSPWMLDSSGSPPNEELRIDTNVNPNEGGYRMNHAMSTSSVPAAIDYEVPAHHPALVIPEFLHLFGPLIFPLVRAALLRKRILFLGETPIEKTCNYVYNLSILSSLPKPIATMLPNLDPSYIRLRPLLNVGVSDMALLEKEAKSPGGWVACTTDDVLCTKPDLFDVLVVLPSANTQITTSRKYPKIYLSSPELNRARPRYGIRASQRDAKRFSTLWKGLRSMRGSMRPSQPPIEMSAIASSSEASPDVAVQDEGVDTASVASTASSTMSLKSVVEPQSWSRIAYTSLVWWASAGDKRSGLSELEESEDEQDIALLTGENLDEDDDGLDDGVKTREVACVQYFQRLSNLMFTAVADAVRRSDGYEEEQTASDPEQRNQDDHDAADAGESDALLDRDIRKHDNDEKVDVTQDDIQNMGLDIWSESDRKFVEDLTEFWWERKANVQGGRIECCGVRLL